MSKIKELKVENFKRVHRVEIDAGGLTVKICGANSQGKSSILDAIAAALGGGKLCPEKPIREGQTKAFVSVKLDDGMIAERRWELWKDKSIHTSLEVRSGDGRTLQKPQTVLDRLLGSLSFDPLVFAQAEPKKQLELLRTVMKLDLSLWDTKRAQLYAERTEVGRELDAAKAALLELQDLPAPLPPIDVSALVKNQEEIAAGTRERGRILAAADRAKENRATLEDDVEAKRAAVREAEATLAMAVMAFGTAVEAEKKANFEVSMLGQEAPASSLSDQIIKANAHNEEQAARARKLKEQGEKQKLVDELDTSYKSKTFDIDAIDQEKAAALAEAKAPIEGIGFAESGVTFAGLPFEQSSESDRIKVSTAMGCSLNPELKIIQVRNASLLDEKSWAAMEATAERFGCQIWAEFVGKVTGGITIKDGEVSDG